MGNFFQNKYGCQIWNSKHNTAHNIFYFQKVLTPPNNDVQIVLLSQIQHGININEHIFIAMCDMVIIKLYAPHACNS
jgi:hypothetical protein